MGATPPKAQRVAVRKNTVALTTFENTMAEKLYVGQFARVVTVDEYGPPSYPRQYKVLRMGTSGTLEWNGMVYSDINRANAHAYHEEILIHEAFGQLNLFGDDNGSQPEP